MAIESTKVVAEPSSRLHFIDNWRSALIVLVVLHHVAIVYGAFTPFYYVEPPINDTLALQVLLIFAVINQSWFMGALFLLSGYFTPGSFDRKGPSSFLKERLLRLGIPFIIFYFVLNPISSIGLWQMPSSMTGITTPLTWQVYPHILGMGIMWFVAMLLIFNFGYVAWRILTRNRTLFSMSKSLTPSYLSIGVFILALALVSYLVRLVVPIGEEVIDFPTISYLPQYLSFFILGTVASHQNWFRTMPSSKGLVGFVAVLVVGVILFPLAFSGHLFSLEITPELTNFTGNGHWQSAVYALWDSTFSVGICIGLITLLPRFFNGQGRFCRYLSQHSYTVYIVHIPIVVFLAVALKGIELQNLFKFGMVAVIGVPTCFVVAYIVMKIPLASRIL